MSTRYKYVIIDCNFHRSRALNDHVFIHYVRGIKNSTREKNGLGNGILIGTL